MYYIIYMSWFNFRPSKHTEINFILRMHAHCMTYVSTYLHCTNQNDRNKSCGIFLYDGKCFGAWGREGGTITPKTRSAPPPPPKSLLCLCLEYVSTVTVPPSRLDHTTCCHQGRRSWGGYSLLNIQMFCIATIIHITISAPPIITTLIRPWSCYTMAKFVARNQPLQQSTYVRSEYMV